MSIFSDNISTYELWGFESVSVPLIFFIAYLAVWPYANGRVLSKFAFSKIGKRFTTFLKIVGPLLLLTDHTKREKLQSRRD